MDWVSVFTVLFSAAITLMFLGMPVAYAFLAVNLGAAAYFLGGGTGIGQMVSNSVVSVSSYSLVPIPMFILMGELFFHTGLASKVFDGFDRLLGKVPGRLAYVAVGGGTIFATLSGSSMANTAMLGSSLIPEMTRRGYKKYYAMGPIMGTGALAMIIPPSGLAVMLGSVGRIDVGALLIAGLLPGVILASMYILVLVVMVKVDPDAAPQYDVPNYSFAQKMSAIIFEILPMGLVIFSVVGLIILGWATPTESAAFGVLSVLLLAVIYRKINIDIVVKAVVGATRVTVMLLAIMLTASSFSQILGFSGASEAMISWATSSEISFYGMLFSMICVILFLGLFMEQLAIIMLTVPFFMPIAAHYGFNEYWFGIIILLALEVGLLTPPFGLILFVMKGVAPSGTSLSEVILAALPFVFCAIALMVLIVFIPPIATFLPQVLIR